MALLSIEALRCSPSSPVQTLSRILLAQATAIGFWANWASYVLLVLFYGSSGLEVWQARLAGSVSVDVVA